MGNLRKNVLNNEDVREANRQYREAKTSYDCAVERYVREKGRKRTAREAQKLEQARAQGAYDKAVKEALMKAKEHFSNQKFTAADLARYTGLDISTQEFASWVWHYTHGGSYRYLGRINYHLPKGTKTTGVRTVARRFAELDENGNVIPDTVVTKEHKDCALYWFED